MMRRIGLIDCNNYYVSCQRLMRPDLSKRSVVVLSNSDGCVVARSAEVKALGVPMGMPWHQMQDLVKAHNIVAFSSNYTLYHSISQRVSDVLSQFSPDLENYSIDECFLDFTQQPKVNLTVVGRAIRQRVGQWVGIPVCCGFSKTKTLAKLANHVAKKRPEWNGVCDLETLSDGERTDLFRQIPVREVWGVGRKIEQRLVGQGIATVADLRGTDHTVIRRSFSVVLERTVRELNGVACIELDMVPANKKQIISSRSFGAPIHHVAEILEPIRAYMTTAADKLRRQESVAGTVGVWIQTNRFRAQDVQHHPSVSVTLPDPTDDTLKLVNVATTLARQIFRSGCRYTKAGVMLMDIRDKSIAQGTLFADDVPADAKRERLMAVMDQVTAKYGRGTIAPGSAGIAAPRRWAMRRDMLSPSYTTRWSDLAKVKA